MIGSELLQDRGAGTARHSHNQPQLLVKPTKNISGEPKPMFNPSRIKPFDIIASFIAIVFVVYWDIEATKSKHDIDAYLKSTAGIIIKYHTGPNTVTYVTYSYTVDGKTYQGSSSKMAFRGCEESGWCIGAKLTIEYSSVEPGNSRINWNEGYMLPDSVRTK
jgi:hypothetical protein